MTHIELAQIKEGDVLWVTGLDVKGPVRVVVKAKHVEGEHRLTVQADNHSILKSPFGIWEDDMDKVFPYNPDNSN